MPHETRRTLGAYVGTSLAWGSTFALIKVGLDSLSPVAVGFGRCFFGAATLLLIARLRRQPLPRGRATWGHLWVVGLLASVIPGIFLPLAETHVSSAFTGITAGIIPLATLLYLVTIFRDEKVHPHQFAGLFVGFVGLLVLLGIWHGIGKFSPWSLAILALVIASYGLAFPYIKRHVTPLGLDPVALAAAQQIASAATIAPLLLWPSSHLMPSLGSLLAVVALGVFAGGLGFMWNFTTVRVWGSSVASTVEYTAALVAVLAGITLLHEHLTWYEPVGGAIVIVGALIGWGQLNGLGRRLRRAM